MVVVVGITSGGPAKPSIYMHEGVLASATLVVAVASPIYAFVRGPTVTIGQS